MNLMCNQGWEPPIYIILNHLMLFQNKRCWNKWLLESLFIISEDKIKCDHFFSSFFWFGNFCVQCPLSIWEAFLMLSEFPLIFPLWDSRRQPNWYHDSQPTNGLLYYVTFSVTVRSQRSISWGQQVGVFLFNNVFPL